MKNLIVITLILTLTFTQVSRAQLGGLGATDVSDENYFPEDIAICYHGSVNDPLQEVIASIFTTQSCPSMQDIPHNTTLDHDPNDPRCRVTKVCSGSPFACAASF